MSKFLTSVRYLVIGVRFYGKGKSGRELGSRFSKQKGLQDLLLGMNTKAAHVPAMKAARKAKQENTPKYPAGVITLQVLGSGAKGAPSSLYIFADQTR